MSTAANHRKRSHRSEYKARIYYGGTRRISMQPTVRKRHDFGLMSMIRRAIAQAMIRRTKAAAPSAANQSATQAP